MKKAVGILFILVLTFDIAGVFAIFKIQQYQVRKEIKRQIKRGVSEEELHVITITPGKWESLQWHDDHEFSLDGEMYDIVRRETIEDSISVYYCINDKQEKELFKHLDDLVDRHKDKNNPTSRAVVQLFQFLSLYFPHEANIACQAICFAGKINIIFPQGYVSPDLLRFFPPPRPEGALA